MKFAIPFLLALPVALVSFYWLTQTSDLPEPFTPQAELTHKATSPEIAMPNHRARIGALRAQLAQGAHPELILPDLYSMEIVSARILGDVEAYQRIEETLQQAMTQYPNSATLKNLWAKFEMAVHRYDQINPDDLITASDRLHLEQIRNPKDQKTLQVRQQRSRETGDYQEHLLLSAALLEQEKYEAADQALADAITAYRDVSPLTYAWLYFLRGVIAGEKVDPPRLDLARDFYEKAVTYVPDYAQARVHLSEVYASQGDLDKAVAVLLPVAEASDPEVQGKLYQMLKTYGRTDLAMAFRKEADAKYQKLLERFPLAFKDHADEFYAY